MDVFRESGGIYGTYPNRLIMCSGRNTALMFHVGLAHEDGYLACKGWDREPKADAVLEVINEEA